MKRNIARFILAGAILFSAQSVKADYETTSVYVSFSGGSGDNLTMDFSSPITLTTSASSSAGLCFVLDGLGDIFSWDMAEASGSITVDSVE